MDTHSNREWISNLEVRRPRQRFRIEIIQALAGHFAIIEVDGAILKNLIIFVAFSGDEHEVSGAGFFNGATAAMSLVPLGQSDGSRVLRALREARSSDCR